MLENAENVRRILVAQIGTELEWAGDNGEVHRELKYATDKKTYVTYLYKPLSPMKTFFLWRAL